jgi:hypothetical protein
MAGWPPHAAGQVRVSASVDRTQVRLDEAIELRLRVEGTQEVQAPELTLTDFLAPYRGPATSISIVNGVVSSSITHVYSLLPQREGTLTIESIQLEVAGTTHTTDPIAIHVLPATARAPMPPGAGGPGAGPAPAAGDERLRLELAADTSQLYVHETVPARVQLLVGRRGVRDIELPQVEAEGLLVTPFGQPRQSDLLINGQPWAMLEFETALVPIRSGELRLGPATLTLRIAVRRRGRGGAWPVGEDPFEGVFGDSFFDEFFSATELYPVTLTAEPIVLKVLPLPEANRPADFAGAVGSFTLQAQAVPTEVRAGEPVTLTMSVMGTGNFETVTAPRLDGSLGQFKVYEPKALPEPDQAGRPFQKRFEQVLIPLDPSVRETPAVRFSYFNPEQGRYDTLTAGPMSLSVHPAPAQEPLRIVDSPAAPSPQPLEVLGRDIVYIKETLEPLSLPARPWHQHPGWLAWQIIPLLLLAISEATRRRREGLLRDPIRARASSALHRALTLLRAAQRLSKEDRLQDCHAEIFRALQTYVGDRFNRPAAAVTHAELAQCLRPQGVPEELVQQMLTVVDRCDAARFAPAASMTPEEVQATLRQTEAALRQLERWTRR